MAGTSLVAAALLVVAVGAVHSWLGEVRLIGPLLAPSNRQGVLAHPFARSVLRFAWHLTTLAWWGFAAVLVVMAQAPVTGPGRLTLSVIAAMFFATGATILIAGRGRHLAWPVFAAIAGLTIVPLF